MSFLNSGVAHPLRKKELHVSSHLLRKVLKKSKILNSEYRFKIWHLRKLVQKKQNLFSKKAEAFFLYQGFLTLLDIPLFILS